jgi:hypothetical protein
MSRTFLLASLPALALAACVRPPLPEAPARGDFSAHLVDLGDRTGPPPGPEGACWQADIRPAVIETVTEQVLVRPELRAEDGSVTPAVYATETHQRMVEDRGTVWFRAPCPAEMTPEFVATLQRALKARGLYLLPLTGVLDAPTRTAIRRYQTARGLDSDHLSLAAARDLGLVAADPGRL